MSKDEVKDVIVTEFPKDGIAIAEGATAAGKEFMNKKYGTVEKQTIQSSKINSLFAEIKENDLNFSFKATEVAA